MADHMYTGRRNVRLTPEQYYEEWSKKYKYHQAVATGVALHASIDPEKLQKDQTFKNGFARLPMDEKVVYFFNSIEDADKFLELLRAIDV